VIDPAHFSAPLKLRDGRQVEIRAQRPEDGEEFELALSRMSDESLYRRFFSVRRNFSQDVATKFLDIDFVNHVALVAIAIEAGDPNIVGTGRYIVEKPGQAEVAFAVIDAYQGQGIGGAVMGHLAAIARTAGLKTLTAEVLAGNAAMLNVFRKSGLPLQARSEREVVHVTMSLT
jgi:RimJ/RimL family protein N-acetyltransferase